MSQSSEGLKGICLLSVLEKPVKIWLQTFGTIMQNRYDVFYCDQVI